jgi:hypothetical protein
MAGRFMLNKRRSGTPLMPFAQPREDFLAGAHAVLYAWAVVPHHVERTMREKV